MTGNVYMMRVYTLSLKKFYFPYHAYVHHKTIINASWGLFYLAPQLIGLEISCKNTKKSLPLSSIYLTILVVSSVTMINLIDAFQTILHA